MKKSRFFDLLVENRDFFLYPLHSTRFNSEMMQDRAIVAIEGYTQAFEWYQFEWPPVTYNPDFKVTIIQRQITWKWYNIELHLQCPTNRRSYMVYRTAPFSMTLNDPYPRFQGHDFLSVNISETIRDTDCFNKRLIGTYTCPTQQCHLEWLWVTLSDLPKYSVTRRIAQSLCDSWASCSIIENMKWFLLIKT